jgi:hypothetical protein
MKLKDLDKKFVTKINGIQSTPTFGGDPEFFVANSRGTILASDKFFPGKENKIEFAAKEPHGCYNKNKLFFDGIQAEMNLGVTTCREYFTDNVYRCLHKAIEIIGIANKIVLKPSVKVRKEIILMADPEARRFGCMPDFNAYTRTTNTGEIDATKHPYRYAGGHIHIGISSKYLNKDSYEYQMAKTEEGHIEIIKLLDLIVGIPSVLLDNSESSIRRRSQYGKAGCFRPTPYGIEYRTPSCFWIKAPELVSLMTGLARLAWTLCASNLHKEFLEKIKYEEQAVRETIDNSDVVKANEIWLVMRPYVALMGKDYTNPLNIKAIRTSKYGYISNTYVGQKGKMPHISDGGKVMHGLAAFEYIVNNGLAAIFSNDVATEWAIGKDKRFKGGEYKGFINGMYQRLIHNTDFSKFQLSLLKDII